MIFLIRNWLKKAVLNGKYEVLVLNFIILLFLFRTAIPFFKYPFILLYALLIITVLRKQKINIKASFITLLKTYFLMSVLLFILIMSFLFSNKLYLVMFKDILNTIVILSFFYFLTLTITKREQLVEFMGLTNVLILFFAIVISYNSLFNVTHFEDSVVYVDYNFALIPVIFAFIFIMFLFLRLKSFSLIIIFNVLLFVFTINIFCSESRRGLVVLFGLLGFVLFFNVFSLFKNDKFFYKIAKSSRLYVVLIVLGLIFLLLFVFKFSYKTKNNLLYGVGVSNINKAKEEIALRAYRYFSLVNDKLPYPEFKNKLWSHEFNPYDPESGWGSRYHKSIYPLIGDGSDILPEKAIGYLMDSTCDASTWDNNAYSYTQFVNVQLKENERLRASVYCYVSKEFNGTWVRLNSLGKTRGKRMDYYDLTSKERWVKLEIEPDCKKGNVPVYLYFAKYGETNFSNLKGYVIFAFPSYEIISGNDTITFKNTLPKYDNLNYLVNLDLQKSIRGNYQKEAIINSFPVKKPDVNKDKLEDSDPIRNWIKFLFNEDTTYYGYHTDINISHDPINVIQSRTNRWKFALQIFKKEYNWTERIFGGGFDYLNWYGYYFYKDKTKSDWPHNPFLSVLLYSGITGLLLYIFFLYKVVYYYWLYRKDYALFGMFFLITFFFSFFSANSPFDPPVMGFFVILPFFIHYIHTKEKSLSSIESENK